MATLSRAGTSRSAQMPPPRLAPSLLPGGRGGGTTQAAPPAITTCHCRPGPRPPATTTRQRRRGRRTRDPPRAALMVDAFFRTTRSAPRGTRLINNSSAWARVVPPKPGGQSARRPGPRSPGRAPLDLPKCPHPVLHPPISRGVEKGARRRRFHQLSRRAIAGQGPGLRQRRRGNDDVDEERGAHPGPP